jgi:ABC-type uncharacterized transport system fused permease/ATPase subunit
VYPLSSLNGLNVERESNILKAVGLDQFVSSPSTNKCHSDIVCDTMSTGQRQCLSIARLLYHSSANTVAFLDEVTSAMDEQTEECIYSAVVESVGTFVSVGHRSTIKKFHTHELRISKHGTLSFQTLI